MKFQLRHLVIVVSPENYSHSVDAGDVGTVTVRSQHDTDYEDERHIYMVRLNKKSVSFDIAFRENQLTEYSAPIKEK